MQGPDADRDIPTAGSTRSAVTAFLQAVIDACRPPFMRVFPKALQAGESGMKSFTPMTAPWRGFQFTQFTVIAAPKRKKRNLPC